MLDIIEYIWNEFKVKLTDKFEEDVISFLNTNGGNIYIDDNANGNVIVINIWRDYLETQNIKQLIFIHHYGYGVEMVSRR